MPQLAARIGGTSESMSIRGASKLPRLRRNAISSGTPEGISRAASARVSTMGTKVLDIWRDFVNRRWNAEARFLNLEVSY